MRLFPLLLALLVFSPCALAQDKQDKIVITDPAPKEEGDKAAAKSDAAMDEAKAAPQEEKSKIDWIDVESTGTLGSGKGVDKTLWRGQKRSDIEFLVAKLPTDPALRSVFALQRRLLLSKTDTSLIVNDIGPLRGNDFLIQRINKLMDMGLYDDAWALYTEKAENPYDVSVAQIGMVLLIMRNDLATACLEEKVFATRYAKDKVFNALDRACSQTLGGKSAPTFTDSKVLQAVYNDPSYSVSATGFETLSAMSDLERALVLANGKIKYTGLSAAILAKTPSSLVSMYLMDKNLPEDAKAMIRAEVTTRGLTPYIGAVSRDEAFVKAKAIHDVPSRWAPIESAITAPGAKPGDMKKYAEMLSEIEPANLSTETLTRVLGVLLAANHELSDYWLAEAQKQATQKPIIYIYLQASKSLSPTKIPTLEKSDVLKALQRLKPQDSDQIIAIIDTLDAKAGFAEDSLKAYDKHLGLTLENNYVMPTIGLNILLETAPEQKQTGITVLAVLNSLAAKPDNMYSGSVRKALYSMLNVGLLEDAKLIGSETIASVLNKY